MEVLNKTAVYAFACWIATIISYFAFLAWAFVPENVLQCYGITYYPSKYYALALPAYLMVLYWFINTAYVAVNMLFTADGTSINTVCDSHSKPVRNDIHNNSNVIARGVPEVGDLSPAVISKLLLEKHLKRQL